MAHQPVVRFSLQECVLHRKEGISPSFVSPYIFHNLVNDLWVNINWKSLFSVFMILLFAVLRVVITWLA